MYGRVFWVVRRVGVFGGEWDLMNKPHFLIRGD